MIKKHLPQRSRRRCNGWHVRPPVEPLSDRVFRLRVACGYSIYELAELTGVLPCTIRCLEAGKAVDKRTLPALATALGVPHCHLVCGEHDCTERACIRLSQLPCRSMIDERRLACGARLRSALSA